MCKKKRNESIEKIGITCVCQKKTIPLRQILIEQI